MSKRVSALSTKQAVNRAEKKRAATEAQNATRVRTGDSFQNFEAKIGLGTDNLSSGGTYGFHPITRDRTLLEWMHRGSWVAGLSVDIVADDMTREGVDILGEMDSKDIEAIEELATSLNVWGEARDNIAWGRLYGGSILVMMIGGQDYSTPLRIDSIGKGQFKGVIAMDRWMLNPSMEDLVTEEGPFMGLPKYYTITANAPGLRGKKIHYTRCIRVEGNRLPYWQRVAENLWGESVYERIYDRILAFDSSTQGAAQLTYKAHLRSLKIKGLREAIALGGDAINGIAQQVQHMARMQASEGITIIDGEDELETSSSTGAFSGLAEILIHLGQQLSGGIQIPLIRFFGQSPAGLNSSGESDLVTWYDNIKNLQTKTQKVGMTLIYRAMAQSLGIKTKPGFGIKFRPLWQLKPVEKADIAEKKARTVVSVVEAGLISPMTAMKELHQSSKETDVFTNITKEDIANAEPELPPLPVEVAEIKAGAEEDENADAPAKKPKAKAA